MPEVINSTHKTVAVSKYIQNRYHQNNPPKRAA